MNRRNRLRRAADIARVRTRGAKVVTRPLVFFVAPGGSDAARGGGAGVTATRFSGCVANRLRRRVREAMRCQLSDLPRALDIVALPRQSAAFAPSEELAAAVARGFRQSQARLAE